MKNKLPITPERALLDLLSTSNSPTEVTVTRIRTPDLSDFDDGDIYAGYLVDIHGNFLPSPRYGEPLRVAGNQQDVGVCELFTQPVQLVVVYNGYWVCVTDDASYRVDVNRTLN